MTPRWGPVAPCPALGAVLNQVGGNGSADTGSLTALPLPAPVIIPPAALQLAFRGDYFPFDDGLAVICVLIAGILCDKPPFLPAQKTIIQRKPHISLEIAKHSLFSW